MVTGLYTGALAFSSEEAEVPGGALQGTVGPLTSAQGLRVVPVRVPHVDALNDGRALLQGVTGVAGELHDSPNVVGQVGRGEVPILNVGLVAVAFLKGWGGDTGEGQQLR